MTTFAQDRAAFESDALGLTRHKRDKAKAREQGREHAS